MVARLTADGRSAIAVIGVFGMSEAEFRVRFDAARPTPILVGQVRYGSWSSSETVPGESVVVTRTGDVGWEIHCHGGRAAVRAILDSLVLVGAVEVDAEVWRRAEAARLGTPLAVVEAESCLLRCQTVDDAACVLDQVRGALVDWARHWHDAIDNGDVATGDWQAAAETVLQRAPASEKILRSRRVVLFGPPNVGKSSLINQIMGVGRSIVHEVAGTTRDVLDSATVLGGVPVTLSDTAGLRETGDAIEREGVRRARLAIGGADLVVLVVDPSTRDQAAQLWREIDEHAANTPVVRVLNQADRLDAVGGDGEEDWIKTVAGPGDVDSFSAVGINELIEVIARTLADQRPPRDVALPMTARQIAVLERLAACRTSESVLVLLDELIGGEDGALS